jgi:hypothetical protein
LDVNGELLPMDDFGRPLDPLNGQLLPTNEFGQFIYTAPSPQVEHGQVEIIDENGKFLPKNSFGRYTDFTGKIIELDEYGRPLNHNGRLLSKTTKGQFIWVESDITRFVLFYYFL